MRIASTDTEQPPMTAPAAIAYAERAIHLGVESGAVPDLRAHYGNHSQQQFEIFAPKKLGAGRPICIFFHGGAWIHGELAWLRFMAPHVTEMGAIFVAATYRLAPAYRWPTQLEDACAAVQVSLDLAKRFGGDPDRLALGGHSAGGQLAMLAALRKYSAPCLTLSAPLDLRYGDVAPDSLQGRVYKYLLAERTQDADASPICFAQQARASIHLTWGEQDFPHVVDSNERMLVALRSAGAEVASEIVAGATHFDTHLALANPACPWYASLDRAFTR